MSAAPGEPSNAGSGTPSNAGSGAPAGLPAATLEPELDVRVLQAGRRFPPVAFTLDDASVDAYLQATGEGHPAFDPAGRGLAPPMFTTMVRFVKASLGGRWPSGTLQLDHRIALRRALRRGESLTIDARIAAVETRGERRFFEIASDVRDAQGAVIVVQSSRQLWAGAVQAPSAPGPAPGPASPLAPSPASAPVPDPSPASAADRIGPVGARFGLDALRAFGAIAGALDPIHVDPDFARRTRWGVNIVPGRLAMTLLARLMLERLGDAWLQRGRLELRFVRPVLAGEPIAAWAQARADGAFAVWCENARGERAIEGTAGLASDDGPQPGNRGGRP